MFDQNRDKSLKAAENGAVYDYRPMFGIVGANVFEIKILGLRVIELYRRTLMFPFQGIRNRNIDLLSDSILEVF